MNYEIELINVGRENVCETYQQKAESQKELLAITLEKVSFFLLSKNVAMAPVENDEELWNVFAGIRCVGHVKIREQKDA